MSNYKLLILGVIAPNKSVLESISSAEKLTKNLEENFKSLPNVEVVAFNKSIIDLPKADFVIVISYATDNINLNLVREKTGAKKIIYVCECGLPDYDFGFVFNSNFYSINKTQLILAPIYKKYYKNIEKESKTILIDHSWKTLIGTNNDWSQKISDWLQELKNEYKI